MSSYAAAKVFALRVVRFPSLTTKPRAGRIKSQTPSAAFSFHTRTLARIRACEMLGCMKTIPTANKPHTATRKPQAILVRIAVVLVLDDLELRILGEDFA